MSDRSGLYLIGEVAKMFRVSVGTLRHYEKEGLVLPEYVDEDTGYRYYGPRQFEALNTVRCMRALDMPLDEIADFLADRNLDAVETKLRRQKDAVLWKKGELARIERRIDERLRRLSDARASVTDRMELRSFPPCRMILREEELRVRGYLDMETPIRRLVGPNVGAEISLGKVGLGISAERLDAGEYSSYDRIFLLLDEADEYDGPVAELPAEECVTVRYRGSHAEAPEQYVKMMRHITLQGLHAVGFAKEITLIDYVVTNDTDAFVTEIRVPVAR